MKGGRCTQGESRAPCRGVDMCVQMWALWMCWGRQAGQLRGPAPTEEDGELGEAPRRGEVWPQNSQGREKGVPGEGTA